VYNPVDAKCNYYGFEIDVPPGEDGDALCANAVANYDCGNDGDDCGNSYNTAFVCCASTQRITFRATPEPASCPSGSKLTKLSVDKGDSITENLACSTADPVHAGNANNINDKRCTPQLRKTINVDTVYITNQKVTTIPIDADVCNPAVASVVGSVTVNIHSTADLSYAFVPQNNSGILTGDNVVVSNDGGENVVLGTVVKIVSDTEFNFVKARAADDYTGPGFVLPARAVGTTYAPDFCFPGGIIAGVSNDPARSFCYVSCTQNVWCNGYIIEADFSNTVLRCHLLMVPTVENENTFDVSDNTYFLDRYRPSGKIKDSQICTPRTAGAKWLGTKPTAQDCMRAILKQDESCSKEFFNYADGVDGDRDCGCVADATDCNAGNTQPSLKGVNVYSIQSTAASVVTIEQAADEMLYLCPFEAHTAAEVLAKIHGGNNKNAEVLPPPPPPPPPPPNTVCCKNAIYMYFDGAENCSTGSAAASCSQTILHGETSANFAVCCTQLEVNANVSTTYFLPPFSKTAQQKCPPFTALYSKQKTCDGFAASVPMKCCSAGANVSAVFDSSLGYYSCPVGTTPTPAENDACSVSSPPLKSGLLFVIVLAVYIVVAVLDSVLSRAADKNILQKNVLQKTALIISGMVWIGKGAFAIAASAKLRQNTTAVAFDGNTQTTDAYLAFSIITLIVSCMQMYSVLMNPKADSKQDSDRAKKPDIVILALSVSRCVAAAGGTMAFVAMFAIVTTLSTPLLTNDANATVVGTPFASTAPAITLGIGLAGTVATAEWPRRAATVGRVVVQFITTVFTVVAVLTAASAASASPDRTTVSVLKGAIILTAVALGGLAISKRRYSVFHCASDAACALLAAIGGTLVRQNLAGHPANQSEHIVHAGAAMAWSFGSLYLAVVGYGATALYIKLMTRNGIAAGDVGDPAAPLVATSNGVATIVNALF
jgi:hypothetical protein